jgi:hypothetical protein
LRRYGHIIPILFINSLPLKFGSKQSTLKILVFRALGLGFHLSPLEQELVLEKIYNGLLKFVNFNYNPFEKIRKKIEIVSKTKDFDFLAKFAWKLIFLKNRGNFELKLNF